MGIGMLDQPFRDLDRVLGGSLVSRDHNDFVMICYHTIWIVLIVDYTVVFQVTRLLEPMVYSLLIQFLSSRQSGQ